ncbi:hypothetical protein [Streptomyces sp. NPDC058249]|uniref:hypothetical protein n=1 Tax=Streptomyces sp. NPDC058249 TaxID=3346403 RepID=UPI0036E723DF
MRWNWSTPATPRRTATPYIDLGSDYYQRLLDPERRTRDLVRQLKALGHDVTLTPVA